MRATQPQAKMAIGVTKEGQPRGQTRNHGNQRLAVTGEASTGGGNIRGVGNFAERAETAAAGGGIGFGFKPNPNPFSSLCFFTPDYVNLEMKPHYLKKKPPDYLNSYIDPLTIQNPDIYPNTVKNVKCTPAYAIMCRKIHLLR